MADHKIVNLQVIVAKVGSGYLAVTKLGGVPVKGHRADTELEAARSLLMQFANHDEDAIMGLDLLLSGSSLGNLLALESGEDE